MTDLDVYEPGEVVSGTLFGTDNPAEVLERAAVVAKSLADLVRRQNLIVTIGQSEHVKVEGWTLLGSMLGVFPVVEWTRPVRATDGETVVGWEARVEARTRNGEVVGSAESECLRSERTWGKRDDYALRSMAQTRAVSKALRLPLGFVMQLAGFDPTPADEMPKPTSSGDVLEGTPMSDGWEDHPPDYHPGKPVKHITDAQKKKLNVLVGKLREGRGRITTEQLWQAVAKRRNLDWTWLVEAKRGRYDGELHWSPLRDDLTQEEASTLIEQLAAVEKEA